MPMKLYNPSYVAWTAAETTAYKYLALDAATDRHQLVAALAGACAAFTVDIAAPTLLTDKTVPAAASVLAADWIPVSGVTGLTASKIAIIVGAARYLRIGQGGAGAGPGNIATFGYQPLPPTSP